MSTYKWCSCAVNGTINYSDISILAAVMQHEYKVRFAGAEVSMWLPLGLLNIQKVI